MGFPEDWDRRRLFAFSQRTAYREARTKQHLNELTAAAQTGDDLDLVRQFQALSADAAASADSDVTQWDGVCDGYCLVWMKLKLLHSLLGRPATEAQSTRQKEITRDPSLQAATEYHTWWTNEGKKRADAGPRDNEDWQDLGGAGQPVRRLAFEQMSRSIVIGGQYREEAHPDHVIAKITGKAGRCIQFDYSVPGNTSNHAIAFYRSHGSSIYCFDPNYGEYKIARRDVPAFLDDVLRRYGTVLSFPIEESKADPDKGTAYNYTLRHWYLDMPRKPWRVPAKQYGV